MRLHGLRVAAFGPFVREQVIDFDRLSAAGVFLLTGPTGVGKTSVLDAVCFALYGQVPGIRDRAKAFHSHHDGSATVAPKVTLELTLQGRRLRVSRSAAWRRPSTRAAAGHVEVQSKALLEERVAGDWVACATRIDEVGLTLRALLGLDRDQFCQVVMLPQGEFQTFLRAAARDRQQILETLFGTQRFQAVERWLAERRRLTARDLETRTQALRLLATRVDEAVGPLGDTGLAPAAESRAGVAEADALFVVAPGWHDLTPGDLSTHVRAVLATLSARVDVSRARSTAAASAAKLAQHRLDEARLLAERHETVREARRRRDELDVLRPVADARARLIADAHEADGLRSPIESAADAVRNAAVTATTFDEASRSLATSARHALQTAGHAGRADLTGRDLREVLDGVRRRHETVARWQQRLAELSSARLRAESARDASRVAADEAESAASAIAAHQQDEERWLSTFGALQDAVQHGAGAAALVAPAERALRAAEEAAATSAALAGERHTFAQVVAAEDRAMREWRAAREGFLAGVAAELADDLRAGDECPVCGSTEHPALARATDTHITQADEAQRFAGLETARIARVDAEHRIQDLTVKEAAALAGAMGRDVQTATAARDEAVAAVRLLDEATGRLELMERERVVRHQTVQRLLERHVALVAAHAAADARRSDQDALHLAMTTQLVADVADDVEATMGGRPFESDLDGRLSEASDGLAVAATQLEALAVAADACARAADTVDRDRRRLDAEVERSVFADADQAAAALLPATELARLEALQRAYESESASVDRTLAEPKHVAAAAADEPDLELLATMAAAAAEVASIARHELSRLDTTGDRLEALAFQIDTAVHDLAPVDSAHRLAESLASLCAGTSPDNATRTALSHYVLATRFAHVVAAANVRLSSICEGRYQLLHTFEKGAGESRGGLGLRVLDAQTDRDRDTGTLSGGETFYVSLSLALGLADIVTEESTGAELQTLFVDEGFGALDDTTREEVLDELDALRAGGRTIGLVSHLAELRARFPTQLRVSPGRNGSTCTTVSDSVLVE